MTILVSVTKDTVWTQVTTDSCTIVLTNKMYVLVTPKEHSAVILEGHAEGKRSVHTFMEIKELNCL